MNAISYNEIFLKRTKVFALDIIRLSDLLPKSIAATTMGRQIVRSATSVAANYRAMCIARSDKERFAKLCIVVEETDETLFWLEMFLESGILSIAQIHTSYEEAKELIKVFMAYRSKIKLS